MQCICFGLKHTADNSGGIVVDDEIPRLFPATNFPPYWSLWDHCLESRMGIVVCVHKTSCSFIFALTINFFSQIYFSHPNTLYDDRHHENNSNRTTIPHLTNPLTPQNVWLCFVYTLAVTHYSCNSTKTKHTASHQVHMHHTNSHALVDITYVQPAIQCARQGLLQSFYITPQHKTSSPLWFGQLPMHHSCINQITLLLLQSLLDQWGVLCRWFESNFCGALMFWCGLEGLCKFVTSPPC